MNKNITSYPVPPACVLVIPGKVEHPTYASGGPDRSDRHVGSISKPVCSTAQDSLSD